MESQPEAQSLARVDSGMTIVQDNVSRPDLTALLDSHFRALDATNKTNNQKGRVLDLSALQHPSITVFTARNTVSGELMGCAALKQISPSHGELKSMRTAPGHQRKGVAAALLKHIVGVAKSRHYQRVILETGVREEFAAARELYLKSGFEPCDPFEGYEEGASMSVFMTYQVI